MRNNRNSLVVFSQYLLNVFIYSSFNFMVKQNLRNSFVVKRGNLCFSS
nr:MAG TPA: hypothetical protein [Caudoviricetes sp.]